MNNLSTLNHLLLTHSTEVDEITSEKSIYLYGQAISRIDNVVVVISDLLRNENILYCGLFGKKLGIYKDS
ncbi:MAG: hypothetical protein K2G40_09780, partial [Muribaculaceae bacterium]|nr:hypothetical protein [Muribaculaceae bacterium]